MDKIDKEICKMIISGEVISTCPNCKFLLNKIEFVTKYCETCSKNINLDDVIVRHSDTLPLS